MSNKKKTSQRNQEIINAIIEHRNRKKTDKVYREESEKVRKVLEENLLIIGNDSED